VNEDEERSSSSSPKQGDRGDKAKYEERRPMSGDDPVNGQNRWDIPPVSGRHAATRDEIYSYLEEYNRGPFLQVLADFLECKPEKEAIEKMARAHPAEWTRALANVAKLAGFHDKLEIEGNIHHDIGQLGDAALLDKLDDLRREREEKPAIDVSYEDVTPASPEEKEETP